MKERPIIFSGPMVQAILANRKTQTRRLVKPTMRDADGFIMVEHDDGELHPFNMFDDSWIDNDGMEYQIPCPYGVPGDRLWVQETWRTHNHIGDESSLEIYYRADSAMRKVKIDCWGWLIDEARARHRKGWRSPLMPRWASRILLEVTDVRVERLREISEADAAAEGVERPILSSGCLELPSGESAYVHPMTGEYRDGFATYWDSINGKKAPWESNPWVWVVSFKAVDR